MEKKFLIPTVIGVLFLAGIVFTVVYKKTSNAPNNPTPIETVAPKETEPIETKVSTQTQDNTLEDFKVNQKGVREAGDGKSIEELIDGSPFTGKTEETNNSQENAENEIATESENTTEGLTEETLSMDEVTAILVENATQTETDVNDEESRQNAVNEYMKMFEEFEKSQSQ